MTLFFPFDKLINASRLHAEIFEAGLGSILEYVQTKPNGTVSIAMDDSITAPQETTLTGVVTSHINTPLPLTPASSGVSVHTIDGLSGMITLDILNDGILTTGTQLTPDEARVEFTPMFDSRSGLLLKTTSDLVSSPAVQGVSLDFTPTSGVEFVINHGLNTDIWTWSMWRSDTDPICSILPRSISPSGNNHVIINLASPATGKLVLTSARKGDKGDVGATGLTGSGTTNKTALPFTTISGVEFVLEHGLNTSDFITNMYHTDVSPIQRIIPCNITPSGVDHIIVKLAIPMNGKIVIIG